MVDGGCLKVLALFFYALCQGSQADEWKGVTSLHLFYHIAGDLGSVYLSTLAEWDMWFK